MIDPPIKMVARAVILTQFQAFSQGRTLFLGVKSICFCPRSFQITGVACNTPKV